MRDLPTLKEFTELTEESRRVVETELGDTLEKVQEDLETIEAINPGREPSDPEADPSDAPTVAIARPEPAPDSAAPETERFDEKIETTK